MTTYEILDLVFSVILQTAILIVSILSLAQKKSYPSGKEK